MSLKSYDLVRLLEHSILACAISPSLSRVSLREVGSFWKLVAGWSADGSLARPAIWSFQRGLAQDTCFLVLGLEREVLAPQGQWLNRCVHVAR